jgi:recombination protein RecA
MPTIEELMAALPPEIRKKMRNGSDLKTERQPVPSLYLTKELGGGFGYGRIVTIHGSKSAGKSSFCLEMIAMAQKEGKLCAWLDAEKAYDSAWAQKLGVDTDKLLISRATDMHRAGDEATKLIEAGVDILVIDSTSALIQPSFLEKDGDGLAGMQKTSKIGDFSKGLKALIRSINYVNDNCLVIFISQQTTHIATTYTKMIPEGGKAIEYYSSQVVKLNSTPSMTIETTVQSGNRSIKKVVGRNVDFLVDFNKLGPAGGTGSYQFYFLGDTPGVDQMKELILIGMEEGVVEKGGAWFKFNEHKFQGEQTFINELRADDKLREELRNELSI